MRGIGALLQAAQFPWRWLVLTALCVSILAGLVAAQLPQGRNRGLSLPLLALAAVVILGSYSYLQVQISEPAEGPVSLAGLMRFQQSSDEMTGSTRWVKEIPKWSPMADYYISQANQGVPVKPVDSKLDYTVFDYKTFGAESVANTTVSEEIWYANKTQEPQDGRVQPVLLSRLERLPAGRQARAAGPTGADRAGDDRHVGAHDGGRAAGRGLPAARVRGHTAAQSWAARSPW